jgi:hypothetical protein
VGGGVGAGNSQQVYEMTLSEHEYYTLIYAFQFEVICKLKKYDCQNVRLIYSYFQRLFKTGGIFNAAPNWFKFMHDLCWLLTENDKYWTRIEGF